MPTGSAGFVLVPDSISRWDVKVALFIHRPGQYLVDNVSGLLFTKFTYIMWPFEGFNIKRLMTVQIEICMKLKLMKTKAL